VSALSDDELADGAIWRSGSCSRAFQLLPRASALENVELPLVYRGVGKKERHDRAVGALKMSASRDRMKHKPAELSGGQRQRVAIAAPSSPSPRCCWPTSPPGTSTAAPARRSGAVPRVARAGHTIVLVTHEPKLAARCPRAVRLVDGLVIADGPGREVAMANAEALGAEALAQFHAEERAAQAGARP